MNCSKIICNTLCLFNPREDPTISLQGSIKYKSAPHFSEWRITWPRFPRSKPGHVSTPPPSPASMTFLRTQLTADIDPASMEQTLSLLTVNFLLGLVLFVCDVGSIYNGSLSASFVWTRHNGKSPSGLIINLKMKSETDNEQVLSNCGRHPTASVKIRTVPRPQSSQMQPYFISH